MAQLRLCRRLVQEVRIAIIGLRAIGPHVTGGIEKAVEALSTRFVALGHDVTVFCRARYASEIGDTHHGVQVRRLPAIYTKHLEAITNTVAAILCSLRGFDVIHVNATGPALLSFLPRIFRRSVVVTVHGLDWKREKWGVIARWVLMLGARAAAVFPQRTIVVSKMLRAHYRREVGCEVTYIPNGVDLPAREVCAAAPGFGLEPGKYVLFLSRLVPEKGCHTLIEAFRRLQTTKKLAIVGEHSHSKQYADGLRKLAAGDDRIIFTGPLVGGAKDAIYRGAYAFVLPSTIEGMALVLLEAMSYGKCCVCSDIPENLEVIDPGQGAARVGMSFSCGDAEDLRQKMDDVIRNPDVAADLGERARSHVAAHFDWDSIARQYLDVFRSLGPGSE
jgi:glycosyltransferase involved in cell wall biosynthesis